MSADVITRTQPFDTWAFQLLPYPGALRVPAGVYEFSRSSDPQHDPLVAFRRMPDGRVFDRHLDRWLYSGEWVPRSDGVSFGIRPIARIQQLEQIWRSLVAGGSVPQAIIKLTPE